VELQAAGVLFEDVSDSTDAALFASDTVRRDLDDHDLPIPQLLYDTLLQLPVDIRNQCISHITFMGGISNIPGLKQRILKELQQQISLRAWDPVHTYTSRTRAAQVEQKRATHSPQTRSTGRSEGLPVAKVTENTTDPPDDEPVVSSLPAHSTPHDENSIDAKLASLALKDATPALPRGEVRAIDSLGAWAGASLVTSLRIRSAVEIEKDRFMSHGLTGGAIAMTKPGVGVAHEAYVRSRQSLGPNAKFVSEKSAGWTLGVWT
jgi:actin-related protein